MEISLIKDNKKQFLDLLLLGDESESMIDRYLNRGDLFALYDKDSVKGVCVVTRENGITCELKNIAVYEQYQGQGYGTALIHYVTGHYQGKYETMILGTGDVPSILSFYEKCGFEPSHRIKNFFTDNYDHPMYEDGIQLVDMVYLKKNLNRFHIRKVLMTDMPKLTELYKNTILVVNSKDYTPDEVEDWASCGENPEHWEELLEEQHYVLAENAEGVITGFGSINDDGYMHTLFVDADFQHQGIAKLLYQYLEKYAQDKGAVKITSEVSITAKPFFEKQGLKVDEKQKRRANKLSLTNFKMSKCLIK